MNGPHGNRDTGADADVESDPSDAPLGADEVAAFAAPVRIAFHHTRARLADLDGLSGKAVLDGIVAAGILADDSAKQVAEITHRQEKGRVESTKVIIEVMHERLDDERRRVVQ